MTDECEHKKMRVTIDTPTGPREVCPVCDDVDMQTLDGYGSEDL